MHMNDSLLQQRTNDKGQGTKPTRRAGIEPAASRFGVRRSAVGTAGVRMRRDGFEPPMAIGRPGYSRMHFHSATYAKSSPGGRGSRRAASFERASARQEPRPPGIQIQSAWKDSNLRPRAPEARALAKLRYTLITSLMPIQHSSFSIRLHCSRRELNPSFSG
jgi:hypothetical protein